MTLTSTTNCRKSSHRWTRESERASERAREINLLLTFTSGQIKWKTIAGAPVWVEGYSTDLRLYTARISRAIDPMNILSDIAFLFHLISIHFILFIFFQCQFRRWFLFVFNIYCFFCFGFVHNVCTPVRCVLYFHFVIAAFPPPSLLPLSLPISRMRTLFNQSVWIVRFVVNSNFEIISVNVI